MLISDDTFEPGARNIPPALLPGGDLSSAVFFDIETTGLSWRTSHLYLIGAAWMQKKLQRLEERIEKERTKGAVERRDAGDRAAAACGDGPAVRRPPGDGGSGEAGSVQGESEAST